MRVLGHRGHPDERRPPNTVAAVDAALAAGADGVVVDVRLGADGRPVCAGQDASALAERHAGAWAPPGIGLVSTSVPASIADMLAATRGRGRLVLHLDGGLGAGRAPLRFAAALVAELGPLLHRRDDVVLATTDPRVLRTAGAALPALRRGLVSDRAASAVGALHRSAAFGVHEVHVPLHAVLAEPGLVGMARAVSVEVCSWGVNRPVDARLLDVAGVAAVVTDEPHRLRDGLRGAAVPG